MKRILLAAVIALMPLSAIAQDFYKGRAAYYAGEYEAALKVLRPLAEQGDVKAQLWLAMMYSLGNRVPMDQAEAVRWYRLAARQGNAQAHFNLGWKYYQGRGVSQDLVAAHMWFNIASVNGYSKAAGKHRDSVAEQLSPERVTEAQRLARVCMKSEYKDCD